MRQFLSPGGMSRLDRIMELRQCSEIEAFEFAMTAGWLTAEKLQMAKERRMAKPQPKPDPGKAPVTGANKNQDNKATQSGKPYPPNRPKAD